MSLSWRKQRTLGVPAERATVEAGGTQYKAKVEETYYGTWKATVRAEGTPGTVLAREASTIGKAKGIVQSFLDRI